MNLLAHVVHDLIQGKEITELEKLPLTEQAALADLKALLEYAPLELARVLARQQDISDWGRGPQFISET